jgi:hypothetical protein
MMAIESRSDMEYQKLIICNYSIKLTHVLCITMQTWNKSLNTEVAISGLVYHVIRGWNGVSMFPDMEGDNGRHYI